MLSKESKLIALAAKKCMTSSYSSTPAILGDGQQVELPTFTCFLEWFGCDRE